MKHARIAIFLNSKGPLFGSILDGFYSEIHSLIPYADVREFISTEIHFESLSDLLERATIEECELIITLGGAATRLAVEAFSKKKYPIPVIYAAINTVVAKKLNPIPFITGVASNVPPEYLPVQMLMRTHPNVKTMLLPFRIQSKMGRMPYEAQQIKYYFSDRGVDVTLVPIEDGRTACQAIAKDILIAVDAIMIPEAGLTRTDIEYLEQLSKEKNKILFGDCQTVLQSGGIYGSPRDFHFAGTKVAEYAHRVICKNQDPSDIPTYAVDTTRSLSVNPKAMARAGVFLADDVVASFDGVLDTKDLPTYPIGHMISTENSLWYGLLISVGQRFQKESTACYIPTNYIGWPGNTEFLRRQATELLTNIKRYDYSHLLFYGGEQAAVLWQIAKEHNASLPPLLIITIDGQDDLAWCTTARAHGCIITVLTIPAASAQLPLELMRDTVPNLTDLTLVCKTQNGDLSADIAQRITTLEAACHKHNITLHITRGSSYDEALDAAQRALALGHPITFWPDTVCAHSASYLINKAHDMNLPVCAGGLMFAQIAPLSFGVDLLGLRETIFTIINNLLNKKFDLVPDSIKLAEHEAYSCSLNEPLCDHFGFTVSRLSRTLGSYSCVPPNHERNIAFCMDAAPPEVRDDIRAQAARKQFQNDLAKQLERETSL